MQEHVFLFDSGGGVIAEEDRLFWVGGVLGAWHEADFLWNRHRSQLGSSKKECVGRCRQTASICRQSLGQTSRKITHLSGQSGMRKSADVFVTRTILTSCASLLTLTLY